MKVLIAGGGIGGLTAAFCCAHFGHEVLVFEQSAALEAVGAGVQIPPNAMKVFQALGISALIRRQAFEPEAIEARMGETGRTIFTIPLANYAAQRWGADYLHIHRADYIAAIKEGLERVAPRALHLNSRIDDYTQSADVVSVTLNDGRQFSGDILIGADGIKSAIREKMLGPDKPVFTGNVAWRAVVPIDKLASSPPSPTACAWMGRKRHGVTYLLRNGTLANFVGVVERGDWQDEGWAVRGSKEDLQNDFHNWHPVIAGLIKSAAQDQLFRWALFDRAPLKTWIDGRAALLGDAAHPMLPFLAQGAAMAVEDSWVIAREISHKGRGATQSLAAYQNLRLARTSKVQAGSRANMKTFHRQSRMGQIGTYGPMWLAGKTIPSLVHKRMDWLYGHDVTS